jgi:hypothetical protein
LQNNITGAPPLNGTASENSPPVLTEYNSQPTVETWTLSNPSTTKTVDNVPPLATAGVQYAYCSANNTLTKVKASDATTN